MGIDVSAKTWLLGKSVLCRLLVADLGTTGKYAGMQPVKHAERAKQLAEIWCVFTYLRDFW
jgi:hypothetical protein